MTVKRAPRDSIKVLIVDDHRSFADALKTVIDLERGLVVTAVVSDGRTAIEVARETHPDIVIMDAEMPDMDGITATREMRLSSPDAQVLVLSADHSETLLARAVEAGAVGFLSKLDPVSEVTKAVRAAAAGEPLIDEEEMRHALRQLRRRRAEDAEIRTRVMRLTPRETQILQGMADGESAEIIAETLGISRHTFRTHVQNILTKLGVHSKLEALAQAIRYGKVRATDPLE